MEEGVYYNKTVQENLEQFTFIKVVKNGIAYGRKNYSLKRITLTFANSELIFPMLKESNDKDKKNRYSPLVINNDNLLSGLLQEDTPLYNYYVENFKKCDIPFRFIEHLYESYSSIRNTFNFIKESL